MRMKSITEEAIALMLKDLSLESEPENNHNQEECHSIPRAGNSSEARPRTSECFLCKEQGHYARDCKRTNQQQAATKDEEEEIKADYLLLVAVTKGDSTYDEDMWMVSRHAANHVTRYEKFLNKVWQ